MSERRPSVFDVDVSPLPGYAFGHRGLIWWGTLGYMVIEGAMFLLVFVVYFYLRLQEQAWPPPRISDPEWRPAAFNLLLMLISCVPAQLSKRRAERLDLPGTRRWLAVLLVMGIATIVVRVFEYPALNVRWDDTAYGSIVWVLLSLHTIHLVTDVVDSGVLLALAYLGPVNEARMVDYSENAMYWYFIVLSTVPVYLILYLAPRLL